MVSAQDKEQATFPLREWQSKAGSTISAKLGSFLSRDEINLVSENGRVVTLKTSTLSSEDQDYVRSVYYRANPIRFINGRNTMSFSQPMYFFDSLQAAVDPQSLWVRLQEWNALRPESSGKLLEHLSGLGYKEVYILDSRWRDYVAGINESQVFARPVQRLIEDERVKVNVILIDEAITSNNKLMGMTRNKKTDFLDDQKKGFEKIDQFMDRKKFGPQVSFLSLRNLKAKLELDCPDWRIEATGGRGEYGFLQSAALVTLITGEVPPLKKIQEKMIANRKRAHAYPLIPDNSFTSLSGPALEKVEKLLGELR